MMKPGAKIHVLHLIGSTGLYGAERWILALMRAMDILRFRSTLVNLVDCAGERSAVVQAAEQRGLEAFDFVTGGKFNPSAAFRLARWAREQNVAIIHGHGFKSDLIGLLTAKIAGCRMMTTPHGWSLEQDRKLQFYEKIDRFSFSFMDMVCPLSPDLADGLDGTVPPGRMKLIFNGVDIDEIEDVSPGQRVHSGSYLIGYIGQLIERKDMPTLLAAVSHLADRYKDIRLVILGDGAKRAELEDEVRRLGLADRIEFAGFRPDAAAWLKTFDLFVLPSRLEGIPRCIMEALAASLPVVVSDIPGNRDLVVHRQTGLLFPVGNSRALADSIVWMIEHPDEARELGKRGKLKVVEEYSNRKMASEYSLVYENLIVTSP